MKQLFITCFIGLLLQGCTPLLQMQSPEITPVTSSTSSVFIDGNCIIEPQIKKGLHKLSFTLNPSVPSEGTGGYAYTQNGALRIIEYGYYGSLGKVEIVVNFKDEKTYHAIIDEFDYKAPLDTKDAAVKKYVFNVCNGQMENGGDPHLQELFQLIDKDIKIILQEIKNV